MKISATVTKSFKWRGVVQEVGTVIHIPVDRRSQFEKFVTVDVYTHVDLLQQKDPRTFPHYCRPSGSWCSEKLTGVCKVTQCEYQEQP